jgi:hypothetical protein
MWGGARTVGQRDSGIGFAKDDGMWRPVAILPAILLVCFVLLTLVL